MIEFDPVEPVVYITDAVTIVNFESESGDSYQIFLDGNVDPDEFMDYAEEHTGEDPEVLSVEDYVVIKVRS